MAKFNDKISTILNSQLPEFVVADHPKFAEFLKVYYQLLESAELSIDTIEGTDGILLQKPNSKFFGFPLRLSLYNLAKKNPDSSYSNWLNRKPNRKENLARLLSAKQVDRLGKSFFVSGFSNFLKKIFAPDVTKDFLPHKRKIFLKLESLTNFFTSSVELIIYFINNFLILIRSVGLGSFFILLLEILTSKKLKQLAFKKL